MEKKLLTIKWDKQAWIQLDSAYEHIKEDSEQNAEKVRADIISKIKEIPNHTSKYRADKYKNNNDGSYKYFEIYHYRIAFRVTEKIVKIMRIRSTHQEPLAY